MDEKKTGRRSLPALLLDVLRKPLKTLEEALPGGCATLNEAEARWSDTIMKEQHGHETYLGCTYHERSRIRWRPRRSVTAAGGIAVEKESHSV